MKGGGNMSIDARQKKFAREYAQSLNAYQSAIKAGYSESYAKSSSYKLLDIVGISQEIERIREEELDKVQKRFAIGATKAIKWMLESLEDDEVPPTVKSNVAKNLLDYAGHKPIDKQETTLSGDLDIGQRAKLVEKYLKGDADDVS